MGFSKSPGWFRAINKTWKVAEVLGARVSLDRDSIIRSARKATGLTNFGRDFNEMPLDRLLLALEEEAELHPIGRFITRERMVSLLSIRLRAEYFFKKYPQILDQELYPAWIIVGLQRTGTTKLQRLLAEDPDHRVIPSWEVINPVPVELHRYRMEEHEAQSENCIYPHPNDKRLAIAKTSIRALKLMSPGFFAIHPINAILPEEDILLLDISFMSTTPEAMVHLPEYGAWLESADQSEAYRYAVKLLKFLQWMKPAKRWILKSPHHLEFPDLIEKHFGKVHYIWPHRTLYESIPSFLSMVTYNRMIFSDRVRPEEVASHWTRKIGYMLQKALEYRQRPGNNEKFVDIGYQRLITDSGPELDRIYRLNGGLPAELSDKFQKHEREHPYRKHGIHHYSLNDFSIAESFIDRYTSHYLKFIKSNGVIQP